MTSRKTLKKLPPDLYTAPVKVNIDQFKVGDLIGTRNGQPYAQVTESYALDDKRRWHLQWRVLNSDEGELDEWEGRRSSSDVRWQIDLTSYVIEEEPW